MFSLLRLAIWIAGIITVATFVLGYFGYEPNLDYWNAQKEHCAAMLSDCRGTFVRKGADGVVERCQWDCVDPGLLIRKR